MYIKKPDVVELTAIKESPRFYDELEIRLKRFFRDKFYIPLLREIDLSVNTIKNSDEYTALKDALFRGVVTFGKNRFSGKFSAQVSKELIEMGAVFEKRTGSFKIQSSFIPTQVSQMVLSGDLNFQKKMHLLDQKLSEIIPEELSSTFKCADIFDKTLYKADTDFRKNVKKIAVVPELTKEERDQISKQWQDNMNLWIKDWTGEQIKEIRATIYQEVMSGSRRESLIPPIMKITKTIQGSHEQSLNKAKFLARQETRLLMAAFKQTRYEAAGSKSYIWRNVHRPKDASPDQHTPGNVRYSHAILDGKEFEWSNPPISTNPGEPVRRNNPGTDFNCRCFSRPLIKK